RTALTTRALDIESPGFDINSGFGIVMADAALQSLPPKPRIVAARPSFLLEFCPNGALDPGETVSLALSLTNVGPANITHLVATLLNSGGISLPSGPQNYGSLTAQGGNASRAFTLTGNGLCGGTNVLTLQLQDGAADLGTLSFVFPLGSQNTPLLENFDRATPPSLPPGWTQSSSV